jgi:RND family efflux transporter MFP subunit
MKKSGIIIFASISILAIGGTSIAAYTLLQPKAVALSYVAAEKHHVKQIVTATGPVSASQNIDLSFERSGRIAVVAHNVGDTVKAGDVLMQLDNATEGSIVQQSQALLSQKQAGATDSDIAYAKAAVDAARADADKTKADTAATVSAAQAALDTAQNNLKLAAAGDDSAIVSQAYENTAALLQTTLPRLDDALTQVDTILGVDNSGANFSYKNLIAALDTSKLSNASIQYAQTKAIVLATHTTIQNLSSADHAGIDAAIDQTQATITSLNQLLSSTSDVLNATITGVNLSQTDLAAKKSTIQGTRSGLTAQSSILVTSKQAIANAKNSLTTYQIAFDKAKRDFTNTQNSATDLVKLKESAYQQALANYNAKTLPVRNVDLAPLRASLSAAAVAYEKTFLKSPINGKISKQDGKVGAITSPNVPVVSVIDETSLQVETLVSETDIAKIAIGNPVDVTIDAYGSQTIFPASVVKVDPTLTQMNGNSGFKVTVQFTKADERIKPGMNANLNIITKEDDANACIPDQSVVQKNGETYVLLQTTNNLKEQRKVTVGVRGIDGWTEITEGLTAGDKVVNFGTSN